MTKLLKTNYLTMKKTTRKFADKESALQKMQMEIEDMKLHFGDELQLFHSVTKAALFAGNTKVARWEII